VPIELLDSARKLQLQDESGRQIELGPRMYDMFWPDMGKVLAKIDTLQSNEIRFEVAEYSDGV
jgi:hypothetical protein